MTLHPFLLETQQSESRVTFCVVHTSSTSLGNTINASVLETAAAHQSLGKAKRCKGHQPKLVLGLP